MKDLPAGNRVLELAFDHPPLLPVARLEIKAHLGGLTARLSQGRCRTEPEAKNHGGHESQPTQKEDVTPAIKGVHTATF